jgi:hypothetical protein
LQPHKGWMHPGREIPHQWALKLENHQTISMGDVPLPCDWFPEATHQFMEFSGHVKKVMLKKNSRLKDVHFCSEYWREKQSKW